MSLRSWFGRRRRRGLPAADRGECRGRRADAARHHLESGPRDRSGRHRRLRAAQRCRSRSPVVDRAGRMRVFIASDNPTPHSIELARRKAYTARTFGRSTLEWRDATEPGKDVFGQRQLAEVIPLGGGYPIKVGNETIGGVGVRRQQSGRRRGLRQGRRGQGGRSSSSKREAARACSCFRSDAGRPRGAVLHLCLQRMIAADADRARSRSLPAGPCRPSARWRRRSACCSSPASSCGRCRGCRTLPRIEPGRVHARLFRDI